MRFTVMLTIYNEYVYMHTRNHVTVIIEAKAGNLRAHFQSDDQIRENTTSVKYGAFTCRVNVFWLSYTACWSAVKSDSFNCFT